MKYLSNKEQHFFLYFKNKKYNTNEMYNFLYYSIYFCMDWYSCRINQDNQNHIVLHLYVYYSLYIDIDCTIIPA